MRLFSSAAVGVEGFFISVFEPRSCLRQGEGVLQQLDVEPTCRNISQLLGFGTRASYFTSPVIRSFEPLPS